MKKLAMAMGLGLMGMMLGLSKPAQAQNRDANVYGTTQSGDRSSGGAFNSDSNGLGNMFEVFHRAVLGVPRAASEVGQEQRQRIGSEAEGFRQRQQELLRQQQDTTTQPQQQTTPTPTPGN